MGRPRALSGFLRDLQSSFFFGWQPVERDPLWDYAVAQIEVRRRAIDTIQNSGWIAGGVHYATTAICGAGLALNAKPNPALFGNNRATASAWGRDVERRFSDWAGSEFACDISGKQTLDAICHQLMRGWFGTGEMLAIIKIRERAGVENPVKVQGLPSTRLVPTSGSNSEATQGIVLDPDGMPLRYCIQNYDMQGNKAQEVEVEARDETGRRVVVHVHDSPPTVVRGLSPLAPVLQVVRQFDQLANATLTSALIQAIFAATITSDMPTEEAMQALQAEEEQAATENGAVADTNPFAAWMNARQQWYENTKLDLGTQNKIAHLFMGEELEFKRSEHPNSNYKPYAKMLLLEIAKCIGITYELLTGDREGATYSSERMGTAENWPLMEHRRKSVAARFMQAVYENWLEAEIEAGRVQFPGGIDAFIMQRAAACKADWRGPAKPTADDMKTAKANEVLLLNKLATREQLCAELGTDYYENFEQIAQEQEEADELGIDLAPPPKGPGGGGGGSPFGRAEGEAEEEEPREPENG